MRHMIMTHPTRSLKMFSRGLNFWESPLRHPYIQRVQESALPAITIVQWRLLQLGHRMYGLLDIRSPFISLVQAQLTLFISQIYIASSISNLHVFLIACWRRELKTRSDGEVSNEELYDLHEQISNCEDSEFLQKIVDVIETTGLYTVAEKTFEFDLCCLEKSTLIKLQKCLSKR